MFVGREIKQKLRWKFSEFFLLHPLFCQHLLNLLTFVNIYENPYQLIYFTPFSELNRQKQIYKMEFIELNMPNKNYGTTFKKTNLPNQISEMKYNWSKLQWQLELSLS